MVINIQQSDYLERYGGDLSVQLTDLLTSGEVTHSEDYFFITIQGFTGRNSITPHRLDTPADGAFASYEALVIPQASNLNSAIEIKVGGAVYSFLINSIKSITFQANYVHTFDITVKAEGLEVSVDTGSMTWGDGADGEGSVELPI